MSHLYLCILYQRHFRYVIIAAIYMSNLVENNYRRRMIHDKNDIPVGDNLMNFIVIFISRNSRSVYNRIEYLHRFRKKVNDFRFV